MEISTLRVWAAACAALVLVSACGDDAEEPVDGGASNAPDAADPDGATGDHDAGDTDGDASSDESGETLLDPPPEGRGIQITMNTSIEAGSEVEHCQFVTLDEPLIVNHDEVRFSTGSHHVLLFTTAYDEIPTENNYGEPVDTSGVFDCSAGVQGYWSATGLIAASQSADGQSAISYPEGVGVRVPGGTVLLINAHYINASTSTLEPEVFINLHAIPEDELEQEGGLLFWYNPFLKVPAAGESLMRAGCEIEDDIHVTNAQSHMHRRGVGYVAELISPEGDRETIYENDRWEDVPVEAYTPELAIEAGSRIEWECAYENAEDRDVYQGPRTTDEMCMFIGSYYPRNDRISFCGRGNQPFLGAQWMIGEGSTSCADSLSCIFEAVNAAEPAQGTTVGAAAQDRTSRLTECLLASDPAVSEPLSDALGCLGSAPPGDELGACVQELEACQAL